MVKCSIIIINYNTARLTSQAVRSVIDHTKKFEYEIIIVDNASEQEDFLVLKKEISEFENPRLRLLRSRINLGFGAGNMHGIQQAKGEFYAFLNSDAFLKEDSILTMIEFLENNSKISIVGAKSIDEEGKPYKAFDYRLSLKKELLGDKFLHALNPGKYPSRKKNFSEPTRVGAVPGSFFVCRAADFDMVGGFDTNLFLYYEEKDLAFRIEKNLKKEIYSLPQTTYIHLKAKSTSSSYEIKKELKISQFYSVRKNLGVAKYLVFYGICFLKFMLKAPFSKKNRNHFLLVLGGASLSQSLKHTQKLISVSK